MLNEAYLFVSTWSQFVVVPGLDAYRDNVVTSALTGTNAITGNTASPTVAADTITAISDDGVTKLTGEDG